MIEQPTIKQMYEFCKMHYYSDDNTLWEPFEYYETKQIEEFIDADVLSLADFLGIEVRVTDYLKMKGALAGEKNT